MLIETAVIVSMSLSDIYELDPKKLRLVYRGYNKRRENQVNDEQLLIKKLAAKISQAVWGSEQEFNKAIDNVSFVEKTNDEKQYEEDMRGISKLKELGIWEALVFDYNERKGRVE